jgi:DNA-binding response OmpR family regulator
MAHVKDALTMHIVHLEDTRPLRDIFKATLTAIRPGCEIHQFMTSDDAVAYIREHGPEVDLFVLDVRVPGSLDGVGVAELVKELGCTGAIVMTSAYMSPGREQLTALDAHWFQKPWQIEDVQEMLRLAARRPTP